MKANKKDVEEWQRKEQLRLKPPTQPAELEEGEPGDLNSVYEKRYKIKGM